MAAPRTASSSGVARTGQVLTLRQAATAAPGAPAPAATRIARRSPRARHGSRASSARARLGDPSRAAPPRPTRSDSRPGAARATRLPRPAPREGDSAAHTRARFGLEREGHRLGVIPQRRHTASRTLDPALRRPVAVAVGLEKDGGALQPRSGGHSSTHSIWRRSNVLYCLRAYPGDRRCRTASGWRSSPSPACRDRDSSPRTGATRRAPRESRTWLSLRLAGAVPATGAASSSETQASKVGRPRSALYRPSAARVSVCIPIHPVCG